MFRLSVGRTQLRPGDKHGIVGHLLRMSHESVHFTDMILPGVYPNMNVPHLMNPVGTRINTGRRDSRSDIQNAIVCDSIKEQLDDKSTWST